MVLAAGSNESVASRGKRVRGAGRNLAAFLSEPKDQCMRTVGQPSRRSGGRGLLTLVRHEKCGPCVPGRAGLQ